MSNELILVCGAGGFLGGKMVEFLRAKGYKNIRAVSSRPVDQWIKSFDDVVNIEGDLRCPYLAAQACSHGVEYVFNFAAKVGGIGYIGKNKVDCMRSALINLNLLEALKGSGAHYFFSSSACVYDSFGKVNPSFGYGDEKIFSEQLCKAYSDEAGINTVIARFTGIYGPGDSTKGKENRDHAPSALARKVVEAKLSGKHEITIWGDGEQTRNFLYVDDAAEAAYRLLFGLSGEGSKGSITVDVGSNEVISISTLVGLLEEIAEIKLKRVHQLDAPRGVQDRVADNDFLRFVTKGWEPSTLIQDGMRAVYNEIWDQRTR